MSAGFDVIVAGAGPAGSTAARECAALGMSVLLLDKAEFPRDKPCGGGVNVRAAKLLPFDLSPVVEREIVGMRISVKRKRVFDRVSGDTLSYLTQRRHLDAFLAAKAMAKGASFKERCPVRGVERDGAQIVVRAGAESFVGRALVVADGANGPTAKLAGVRVPRWKEIAYEGNITPQGEYPPEWLTMFGIDIGSVPGGYGWLFPKGDHVNIGVGGYARIGPALRSSLDALVRYYGFNPDRIWGLRGHPLPVRQPSAPLVDANVALVGDAAGLLDPLSGEGIHSAIWSGARAAAAIVPYLEGIEPDLGQYRRLAEAELLPDLITARELHTLFHLAPPLWAQLVRRSSRAWRLICQLITGDATYSHVKDRSAVLGMGIVTGARLVHAASELDTCRRMEKALVAARQTLGNSRLLRRP